MTNQEIITRGELIRDETVTGANTAQRVGEAFVGIGQNLEELANRGEPIVFTESKEMNAFIKTLFVDKNRFEQTQGVTVNDIYAAWNSSSRHFYLYDAPTGGTLMLDINMSSFINPIYCFGNNLGTFVYLELNTEKLQNSPSIASVPSASNPRPKLTSFATTHVCDPRINNGGFTESPILNKYIEKIWVEITSNYTGSIDDVIGKLTVYALSSIYDGETEMWANSIIIRPQSGTNGFQYNSTSNDNEVILNRTNVSTMYNGVVIHAQIDWESLRLDGNFNGIRTYLTPKAYNPVFWGVRLSENVGDDNSVGFSQKGAKTLLGRIEAVENSGIIETEEYNSENLMGGFWNYNYGGSVGSIFKETRSDNSGWYSTKEAIEVKAGDVLSIVTKGGTLGRAYYLTDKSKVVWKVADEGEDSTSSGTGTPTQITVIKDGYLYANCATGKITEFYIRIVRDNISALQNDVEELRDIVEGADGATSIPKIYNPTVNLKKPTLRVLDIGNSFTSNALGVYKYGETYRNCLTEFINAASIGVSDICLYTAIRSSGSFKSWYDCYNDNDTVTYSVEKTVGGIIQPINGTAAAGDGSRFRSCLEDCTWDIILIHQASEHSTLDIKSLEDNSEGGYLKDFVSLIRTLQPSAVIGFLFTHVSNRNAQDTNVSTATRFRQMCLSIKQICKNYDIDYVVPIGAAIENLRASSLNTTSNGFSEDNHHLAAGLGKYVAAATYFQTIFAPRFNVSVIGSEYNSVEINSDVIGDHTSYSDNFVAVTASNAAKAQLCADLAVKFPWNISNVDEY